MPTGFLGGLYAFARDGFELFFRRRPCPLDTLLPQLWRSNHTAIRKIPETIGAFDQSHYGRMIAPNVSFSTNVLSKITVRRRACIFCVPVLATAVAIAVTSNAATATAPQLVVRPVRATGVIRAVRSVTVLVPFIEGQGGNLSLATLAENGALVNTGDTLATFSTGQMSSNFCAMPRLNSKTSRARSKRKGGASQQRRKAHRRSPAGRGGPQESRNRKPQGPGSERHRSGENQVRS